MSFIHEEEKGRLSFATPSNMNELMVDSKVEDPAAVRVGAPVGGALGKISGDRLVVDPDTGEVSRKEKCLVILKEDPTLGGLIEFYTQNPNTEDDANMVRRFSISSAGSASNDTLLSSNGRYRAQMQGDGNLVITDLQTGQPTWSWMTGPIINPNAILVLPPSSVIVTTPTPVLVSPTPEPEPFIPPYGIHELFVDAHAGDDTRMGTSWNSSLRTMGEAFKRLRRGSVVHLYGKTQEEGLVTPYGCTGVTIKGVKNRPSGRISGVGPKAGGSHWARKDDDSGLPLLRITQQGWRFEDIHFIPNRSGGGLVFTRNLAAEEVTTPDAEAGDHADIMRCQFFGPAPFAIAQDGGVVGIKIDDCFFHEFDRPDNWAILGRSGDGVGYPLFWQIENSRFVANYGDIKMGMHDSVIAGNTFQRKSILHRDSPSDGLSIDLTYGGNNVITGNCINAPETALHVSDTDLCNGNLFAE